MKLIVLDLELNQPSQKIIQIGATSLSINAEGVYHLGHFDEFCNPEEPLDPFIVQLTGITEEKVQKAEKFPEVYAKFDAWIKELKGNVTFVSWGDDWPWIAAQAGEKPRKYLDLKVVFNLLHSFLPNKNRGKGLAGAMKMYDHDMIGPVHNALCDAMSTAVLLIQLVENTQKLQKVEKIFKKELKND